MPNLLDPELGLRALFGLSRAMKSSAIGHDGHDLCLLTLGMSLQIITLTPRLL